MKEEIKKLALSIINDTGFSQQESLKEEGKYEVNLSTKYYKSSSLPSSDLESLFKENDLLNKECVRVDGYINIPFDIVNEIQKHPEFKLKSNPKVMISQILEENYGNDANSFVSYALLNSGSAMVSNRSNLVETNCKKLGEGSTLWTVRFYSKFFFLKFFFKIF